MQFNWFALVGFIAAGGLSVIVQALGDALPNEAKVIANIAAIVVAIAAAIVQFMQPTKSITQDAAIVDKSGNQVASNVTTTTTTPILAPAPPKA